MKSQNKKKTNFFFHYSLFTFLLDIFKNIWIPPLSKSDSFEKDFPFSRKAYFYKKLNQKNNEKINKKNKKKYKNNYCTYLNQNQIIYFLNCCWCFFFFFFFYSNTHNSVFELNFCKIKKKFGDKKSALNYSRLIHWIWL